MMLSTWLALSLVVPQVSGGAPRYRLIELPAPGPWGAEAHDVNERRVAVGTFDPGIEAPADRHAGMWAADGSLTDLTPGTNYWFGRANSINNQGVVVGGVSTRDAAPEGGFRWQAGQFEFLPSRFQMGANHVDERGYVAGYAHSASFQFEPTIWAPDLSYVQHPGLGGADGNASDLNGWGDMVGYDMLTPTGNFWRAFDVRDGVLRDLGALPGHLESFAFATNVRRETVGASGPVLAERAVRWLADGTIQALPRIDSGGSVAYDMNDHGEIVGYSSGLRGMRAALWIDGVGHNLEDLVDGVAGWQLYQARSINERGDIAGFMAPSGGGLTSGFLLVRTDGGHPAVIGPSPALAGGTSTFELVGLTPGSLVTLYLGLRPGNTPVAGCTSTTIDIRNPRVVSGVADLDGNARFDVRMPSFVRGQHVLAQGFEFGRCRRTSLSVTRLD